MRRRSLNTPLWENQVDETIQKVKRESKSRSLKSSNLYECICIFISDHLKKKIFSYATLSLYYHHLKSFSSWLGETEKVTDIRKVNVSHLQRYFSYLENVREYKLCPMNEINLVKTRSNAFSFDIRGNIRHGGLDRKYV